MKSLVVKSFWSRIQRDYICKSAQLLLLSFLLPIAASAQLTTGQMESVYQGVYKTLNQRAHHGKYPLPEHPKATEEQRRAAHDAMGQPLNFPDRVWFPGEWEEVQAILVSPSYIHLMPTNFSDEHYSAVPEVPGYATYYYSENPDDPYTDTKIVGHGPYATILDVQTDRGKVFLYIMDGIQKAGVEAWVRIEKESDELVIRNALKEMKLQDDKIRFIVSPGNSFWFRDCGPICFYYGDDDKLAMLDFFYGRDRSLDDLLPSVLHQKMGIPNYKSPIIWEGGNCLVDGAGNLVTSESVEKHNKSKEGPITWDGKNYSSIVYTDREALNLEQIKNALQGMLGQRQTTVLPSLLYDGGTGHVDLYADAWDENGFLFAKMPDRYKDWTDYTTTENNVTTMFQKPSFYGRNYYDMGRLPFPAKDDGSEFKDQIEYLKYTRTYANHTFVNNYILQPCFSPVDKDHMPTAEWDKKNIDELKKYYPGYKFYCIDMRTLDNSGGSIHCVTKQIPADNPIRILHKSIHGNVNTGELTDIPFSAIITNKSGIANAQLTYRVDEGEWKTVNLTANGNRWYGVVPANNFTIGKKVEYYFKATSNNDKTITKPFNAANGNYYKFTRSDEVAYDANMYDFDTTPMPKEKITFPLNTEWLTEDTTTGTKTGISEVISKEVNTKDGWYTISGTRLEGEPSEKGIYIHNGNKVVIK